jgi:glycosyltransferase involved in cell wall biosynthesis
VNQPLVSICIPSYNSGEFIKQTLESVLAQTYSHIEVVVTDDVSKDNTVQIARSISDPRLKVHLNERNLGVVENWNRSIELASGEYIKIMGADDLLDPTCIEEQMKVFLTTKENIVLVSSYKYVINHKNKLIVYKRGMKENVIDGTEAIKRSVIDGSNIIGEPVAGLFRKEDFMKAGKYRVCPIYMIDMDLWARILKQGKLYVIPKPLYSFRISPTSLSSVMRSSQIAEFNTFVDTVVREGVIRLNSFERFISRTMVSLKGILRKIIFIFFI